MINRKTLILYIFLSILLGSILTLFVLQCIKHTLDKEDNRNKEYENDTNSYNIQQVRGYYKYISPIISAEPVNESDKYSLIKGEIIDFIAKEKQIGLISASVYLRDFSKGNWMAINPEERYNPGSLLKVGVLMTYLRMAETNTNLLNAEIVYHRQKGFVFPIEHYRADTVVEGHKYKINDLINYMIKYSDNRATLFLENYMDTTIFKREFIELGITEPRFNDPHYTLNVKEYSSMFKALYNAGYLRKRASEDALSLLSESTFKEGLLKELPTSIVVAHKFGESGDSKIHELHEAGIIYINNNPYLLTVMTRGTDWSKLSKVIGHISKIVYDKMVLVVEK